MNQYHVWYLPTIDRITVWTRTLYTSGYPGDGIWAYSAVDHCANVSDYDEKLEYMFLGDCSPRDFYGVYLGEL